MQIQHGNIFRFNRGRNLQRMIIFFYLLVAREDRYNHLFSDEDDYVDDIDDIEIGNFSTCSPRYSITRKSGIFEVSYPIVT